MFVALRVLLARQKLGVQQFFVLYLLVLIGIALIYLGLTGRLNPLFAALGFLLPFLSRIFTWGGRGLSAFHLFRRFRGLGSGSGGGAPGPGQSEVTSDWLHMTLNHETGDMDGRVLRGRFESAQLSSLMIRDLLDLRRELLRNNDSLNLLDAYLDRVHGGWRDDAEPATGTAGGNGEMSLEEAAEVLAVPADATRDEIIKAHRRLMQKFHPDRGGSDYLAARINQAKDLLLASNGH